MQWAHTVKSSGCVLWAQSSGYSVKQRCHPALAKSRPAGCRTLRWTRWWPRGTRCSRTWRRTRLRPAAAAAAGAAAAAAAPAAAAAQTLRGASPRRTAPRARRGARPRCWTRCCRPAAWCAALAQTLPAPRPRDPLPQARCLVRRPALQGAACAALAYTLQAPRTVSPAAARPPPGAPPRLAGSCVRRPSMNPTRPPGRGPCASARWQHQAA